VTRKPLSGDAMKVMARAMWVRWVQRCLLPLSACLLVAACSMAGLAYNNVVPLASWYIDDYVSLDDAQQERFRESMSRLHAWHRRSELPEYGRLLEQAALKTEGTVQANDILELYADGRRVMGRLAEQALPEMADLLLTLTPAQIKSIEARLRKENDKFMAERMKVPPAQRDRERLQRYTRNVESWMGSLSASQRATLAAAFADIPVADELRLEDRKRLQAEFIALLRNPPPRERMIEQLRIIMLTPEVGRSPAYEAQSRRWRDANATMLARLVADATPQQRKQLQRKLRDYASDVLTLAANR
jgi:Family of unknown function (DUF6279)